VIKHERKGEVYYTNYAHLNAIYVAKGQQVKE
jgi:murein DD-endopeptidase MepM/ murein hydrolase activator NlpD